MWFLKRLTGIAVRIECVVDLVVDLKEPLVPFENSSGLSLNEELLFTATLSKQTLFVNYRFRTNRVLCWTDQPNQGLHRRDNLWRSTCFELFLANPEQTDYLEVNLSPPENWNIYHFASYRDQMRQSKGFVKAIEATHKSDYELRAEIVIGTDFAFDPARCLVGVSAVLDFKPHATEYWALRHSGEKPDFHVREDWRVLGGNHV